MTADELINGVFKYNETDAKKGKSNRNPIVLVPLVDSGNNCEPLVRLSADKMARAKDVIFNTDEAGTKESEKDAKRFLTKKYDRKGKTFACVFVLLDEGTLTKEQKEMLTNLRYTNLSAPFGRLVAKTENDDEN